MSAFVQIRTAFTSFCPYRAHRPPRSRVRLTVVARGIEGRAARPSSRCYRGSAAGSLISSLGVATPSKQKVTARTPAPATGRCTWARMATKKSSAYREFQGAVDLVEEDDDRRAEPLTATSSRKNWIRRRLGVAEECDRHQAATSTLRAPVGPRSPEAGLDTRHRRFPARPFRDSRPRQSEHVSDSDLIQSAPW